MISIIDLERAKADYIEAYEFNKYNNINSFLDWLEMTHQYELIDLYLKELEQEQIRAIEEEI